MVHSIIQVSDPGPSLHSCFIIRSLNRKILLKQRCHSICLSTFSSFSTKMSCKETGIGKADTLSAIHVQLFYFNYFNETVFLIGKESVGPPLRTFFFFMTCMKFCLKMLEVILCLNLIIRTKSVFRVRSADFVLYCCALVL